jgi:hypothetical protein
VHSWDSRDVATGSPDVRRLGIRFAAEVEDLEDAYERVVEYLEPWWESLKEWIEILTAVDVTTENRGRLFAPETAWTRPIIGGPRRHIRLHGGTLRIPPDKRRIPFSCLAKAACLAGVEEPYLEWRLIRGLDNGSGRVSTERQCWTLGPPRSLR